MRTRERKGEGSVNRTMAKRSSTAAIKKESKRRVSIFQTPGRTDVTWSGPVGLDEGEFPSRSSPAKVAGRQSLKSPSGKNSFSTRGSQFFPSKFSRRSPVRLLLGIARDNRRAG